MKFETSEPRLLEMRWCYLEIEALVSLLLTIVLEIKILVTPADLHFKPICFKVIQKSFGRVLVFII